MEKTIICIGREYGSGGHAIGKILAKRTGYEFYDKERFIAIAKERGFEGEVEEYLEEQPMNSLLYSIAMNYSRPKKKPFPFELVEELAAEKPCIIIGRCAGYLTREQDNAFSVFIHADMDKRIAAVMARDHINSRLKAKRKIEEIDEKRSTFRKEFTGEEWGQSKYYNLSIDTTHLSYQQAADLILYYKKLAEEAQNDVVTRTRMGEDGNATAEIAVAVKSEALNPRTSRIHYQLLTPTGENAAAGQKDVTLDMRREDTLRFLARIPANLLWSAELPTQYTLRLKTQHEGRYVEYLELRLGFRSVEMQDGRMSLNARPVTLRVREVPAAITENEIAALREQGFNTLKLLPGPVPESLLNFCDVQGLYVIAQAPIDTAAAGSRAARAGIRPTTPNGSRHTSNARRTVTTPRSAIRR